jgi:oxepin-CoA hydrolase/3-oxo-5,6-dehydrosuberyl-CoA semialdehyde dehydrogenase
MKYKDFFQSEVPNLVSKLKESSKPSFGLMTAQHMIEHLIWVTKSSIKDMGPAPKELSDGQKGFMQFIDKGAEFKYRPSNKTKDDLPALKYTTFKEAKAELPEAIKRFSKAIIDKKGSTFFNPMMGILSPEQMELFHYKHFKWHLEKQFELNQD